MAVVTTSVAITGQIDQQWAVPGGAVLDQFPVPRGLLVFAATSAIAAKITTNESRIQITLTFPQNWAYIQKNMALTVFSDDEVFDWDDSAAVNYNLTLGSATQYEAYLKRGGIQHAGAALAALATYTPEVNQVRSIIDGDTMGIRIEMGDISTDASTAGDLRFYSEFLMYDKAQLHNWPINSPLPRLSY